MDEGNRSTLVQEICFLELHIMFKLKLNILTSSSVTLLNVYTGCLLIIVLTFAKFCANISFVVNEGNI